VCFVSRVGERSFRGYGSEIGKDYFERGEMEERRGHGMKECCFEVEDW